MRKHFTLAPALGLGLLGLGLLSACTPSPTQLIVDVSADPSLAISEVTYVVSGASEDGVLREAGRGSFRGLPGTITVRPQNDNATRQALIEVTSSNTPSITMRRNVVGYIPGQALRIAMHFGGLCAPDCATNESCEAGRCVPIPVTTQRDAGQRDAGQRDAGQRDAALDDAPGDDAGQLDAFAAPDAVVDAGGSDPVDARGDACVPETCNGRDDDCDGIPDDDACVFRGDTCIAFASAGYVYQYCPAPIPWADAEGACDSFPRYALVRIESPEENVVVNEGSSRANVWTQLNDSMTEGMFRFQDGAAPTYTNWQAGEPNNSTGNEDCVVQWGSGLWNDANCTRLFGFVCERPIAP